MRNRSATVQGGSFKSIIPVFIGPFSADTCFANIIAPAVGARADVMRETDDCDFI